MPIQAMKRWHWLVISVVIGLAVGTAREMAWETSHDRLDDYATLLTSSKEFESALVRDVEGQRQFKDIVVYPYYRSGGRKAHLVTGLYWDGRLESVDGQTVARWVPACYVAPVPYRATLPQPGEMASVLEYLAAVHASGGVEWHSARFSWMGEPMFASSAISVIVIGLIWPWVINLLAYGSIFRPREVAGISLWNAPARTMAPDGVAPVTAEVSDLVGPAMKDAALMDVSASPVVPAAPPVAALPVSALEPAHIVPSEAEKDFGARREDFYPTELHTPEKV